MDARRVQGLGRCASPRRFGYAVAFRPVGDEDPEVGRADADGGVSRRMTLDRFPELVARRRSIGPSGCGKSTFARRHFKPTEVLSSDSCRGLVSDDENDQAATTMRSRRCTSSRRKRLARGHAHRRRRDERAARGAQAARRAGARSITCLPVAIVLDLPERLCHERNRAAPGPRLRPARHPPADAASCAARCAGCSARASGTCTC